MKFAIIANPVSGSYSLRRKQLYLEVVSEILHARVYGLDSVSTPDFHRIARKAARKCDCLIIAGGDGTFSEVINQIDLDKILVSYIPLGSGNALKYALNLPSSPRKLAMRIRDSRPRALDLIREKGGNLGLFASVGIEGHALRVRENIKSASVNHLVIYTAAALTAFRTYQRRNYRVFLDDREITLPNAVSLIISKHCFYGYGLRVFNDAALCDGCLHVRAVNQDLLHILYSLGISRLCREIPGTFYRARSIRVECDRKSPMQQDGNYIRSSTAFEFELRLARLRFVGYV